MKILLIDNEPRMAAALEQHCRAILTTRLEQFAIANSPGDAASQLNATAYDVVLLDPQLQGVNAMAQLTTRTPRSYQTIFISARPDLAAGAFDYGALDFVPKPVVRERLARALHRAERRPDHPAPPDQFLAVRRLGRIDLVAVDDLLYVEGADKYSELVLANGRRDFYDQCLGRVEASLPASFVRIHKSFLVRFSHISRLLVQRGSRYFAELKNGQRLPVGRSRYGFIKARLI
jgi:DNA-binding LytR/AlgR family response regulator